MKKRHAKKEKRDVHYVQNKELDLELVSLSSTQILKRDRQPFQRGNLVFALVVEQQVV